MKADKAMNGVLNQGFICVNLSESVAKEGTRDRPELCNSSEYKAYFNFEMRWKIRCK